MHKESTPLWLLYVNTAASQLDSWVVIKVPRNGALVCGGVTEPISVVPLLFFSVFLTHWGRDKMANIFRTTISNAFSWMKMFDFQLRFHWRLFLRVQYSSIGSDNGLAPVEPRPVCWLISIVSGNGLSPVRLEAITWINAGILSLGLLDQISVKFKSEFYYFNSGKCIYNCRPIKWRPFCPRGDELSTGLWLTHHYMNGVWHLGQHWLTSVWYPSITLTSADKFSVLPPGTIFNEILIKIQTFSA